MLIQATQLFNRHERLPDALFIWLKTTSSMMGMLREKKGDAKLHILNQQWVTPSWWDQYTLGLKNRMVMHREVVISSHQIPCWYARTIIPEVSYQMNRMLFDRLKNESLGEIIHLNPSVERQQFINYTINSNCIEYYWLPKFLLDKQQSLSVRLSTFTIASQTSFVLIEILLPGLLGEEGEMG